MIHEGSALPDTGVPGLIQGYGAERVIHAPAAGRMENLRKIGDIVKKGEPIARILGARERSQKFRLLWTACCGA